MCEQAAGDLDAAVAGQVTNPTLLPRSGFSYGGIGQFDNFLEIDTNIAGGGGGGVLRAFDNLADSTDGIFLTGLLAVLLAALVRRQRTSSGGGSAVP